MLFSQYPRSMTNPNEKLNSALGVSLDHISNLNGDSQYEDQTSLCLRTLRKEVILFPHHLAPSLRRHVSLTSFFLAMFYFCFCF